MKKFIGWSFLALLSSALLAACSETIGVPPPAVGTAPDYFWSNAQLSAGVTYDVTRGGIGTIHRLFTSDGVRVQDAAIGNEVTMLLHENTDSVLIDSLGANSIFSLPSGYFFGQVLPPDTLTVDTTLMEDTTLDSSYMVVTAKYDTVPRDTTIYDTVSHDTIITRPQPKDTAIQRIIPRDSVPGGLLLLYRPDLDSGMSWEAGTIAGPGIAGGVRVFATVLDRVNSLLLKPDSASAETTFGESFQIRYAPTVPGDTQSMSFPIYWLVYYSKNAGPVLIEQYTLGAGGIYSVAQRAQLISEGP